jgi:hypothetical protein
MLSMVPRSTCLKPRLSAYASHDRYVQLPPTFGVIPVEIDRKHSRNLACAARNWAKEFDRCSSSSSSCFFTWLSCCVDKLARSTEKTVILALLWAGLGRFFTLTSLSL